MLENKNADLSTGVCCVPGEIRTPDPLLRRKALADEHGGRSSFRLLDLYCGEGLGAWGYWQSGRFSEIVGVDIDDSHRGRYAFDFIKGDCLALTYDFLWQFDFIRASPPCQAYSQLTPDQSIHPRLIAPTRQMLHASGLPHVVENVPGSQRELRPNLMLSGLAFGLPSHRPRFFYVSSLAAPLRLIKPVLDDHVSGEDEQIRSWSSGHDEMSAQCSLQISPGAGINLNIDAQINASPANHQMSHVQAANLSGRARINVHGRDFIPRRDTIAALGLDVIPPRRLAQITVDGMEQGIPPAFTRFIAETVIPEKVYIA